MGLGQTTSTDPNKPSMDGTNQDVGVGVNYASVADTSSILKELEKRELSTKEQIQLKELCYKEKWNLKDKG